jgi:hypothetical protein
MSFAIHGFIREQRDDIMRDWEARVASEPRERERESKLADSALRNHLPEFLDELADWLQSAEAPGTPTMRAAAARHAAQRLDHSFQLTQLAHEYRLLWETLLHLLLRREASLKHETAMAVWLSASSSLLVSTPVSISRSPMLSRASSRNESAASRRCGTRQRCCASWIGGRASSSLSFRTSSETRSPPSAIACSFSIKRRRTSRTGQERPPPSD